MGHDKEMTWNDNKTKCKYHGINSAAPYERWEAASFLGPLTMGIQNGNALSLIVDNDTIYTYDGIGCITPKLDSGPLLRLLGVALPKQGDVRAGPGDRPSIWRQRFQLSDSSVRVACLHS